MAKAPSLHHGLKIYENLHISKLLLCNMQPGEPLIFVCTAPQGSVFIPQPMDVAAQLPRLQKHIHLRSIDVFNFERLFIQHQTRGLPAAQVHSIEQLIECVGEEFHTLGY